MIKIICQLDYNPIKLIWDHHCKRKLNFVKLPFLSSSILVSVTTEKCANLSWSLLKLQSPMSMWLSGPHPGQVLVMLIVCLCVSMCVCDQQKCSRLYQESVRFRPLLLSCNLSSHSLSSLFLVHILRLEQHNSRVWPVRFNWGHKEECGSCEWLVRTAGLK